MNVRTRLMLKNLIPAILSLALIPATCVWGQVPQTPPGETSAQGVDAPASAPSSTSANPQSADSVDMGDPGSGFSFLRVVGGFGLVLSLIIFGTLGIRKYAPQYFAKKVTERSLRLVETLPMGERRSIAVIEIDERRLLIGNTPNQITLLAALGENGAVLADQAVSSVEATSYAPSPSFKNLYEFEKNGSGRNKMKIIPPDIRAKMRQLRESLER